MQEKVKKIPDNVRNAGRRKLPEGQATKSRTVSLNDNDNTWLVKKFGSLTNAIKTLLP